MKKSILFFALATAVAGCGSNKGWPQAVKEKVISSCVGEANAGAAGLDATKLKNYCSCYQQNVEKRSPDVSDMNKLTAQDLAAEAQKCIGLMFQ